MKVSKNSGFLKGLDLFKYSQLIEDFRSPQILYNPKLQIII